MATTERRVFLHWKKVDPLSDVTKKHPSRRGGCEGVREVRMTQLGTDGKGGVANKHQDTRVGVVKTDTGTSVLCWHCWLEGGHFNVLLLLTHIMYIHYGANNWSYVISNFPSSLSLIFLYSYRCCNPAWPLPPGQDQGSRASGGAGVSGTGEGGTGGGHWGGQETVHTPTGQTQDRA